jgi:hypothetical protein
MSGINDFLFSDNLNGCGSGKKVSSATRRTD